jgi:hypothetical protein
MSSVLDMVRSMFGADGPAAKTVAELADNAPGNVSMLVNGVKRADLQTVIGDPNWEATIFCPTNRVRFWHFCAANCAVLCSSSHAC